VLSPGPSSKLERSLSRSNGMKRTCPNSTREPPWGRPVFTWTGGCNDDLLFTAKKSVRHCGERPGRAGRVARYVITWANRLPFSPTHYVYQHPQLVRPERLSDRLVTMIRKMGAEPQEPRFFRPWSTPGAAWGDKRPCNSGAADDPKAA
jgi:hypothetical protein